MKIPDKYIRFLGRPLTGRIRRIVWEWRKIGAIRALRKNGLFDSDFYKSQRAAVPGPSTDLLKHYLDIGAAEGLDPHPLFSTRYYLEKHPDIKEKDINPLIHYQFSGAREGRSLHPLFDGCYYLGCYPDVRETNHGPLLHYLNRGAAEGRFPHPLFDTGYYMDQYPEVRRAGINPLIHYQRWGGFKGCNPHPLFDSHYYLTQYPKAAGNGFSLLAHYLLEGANMGLSPHPMFDGAFYSRMYPEVAGMGLNPLIHYVRIGAAGAYLPALDGHRVVEWEGNTDPASRLKRKFLSGLHSGDHKSDYVPPREVVSALIREINSLMEEKESRSAATSVDVSIIVPIHNHIAYTLGCLRSLAGHRTSRHMEIIVVDDASTDPSPDIIPQIKGIQYLRNSRNLGFTLTSNRGAASARGDYIVFLNNDTSVLPGWLDELLHTFDGHPNVGLAGSKLLYPTGILQEAGALVWPAGTTSFIGEFDDPEKPKYKRLYEVDYCSGAAFAIPSSLWFDLRGFDEQYAPAYFEDADLAYSVRARGLRVVYQPRAPVIHYRGGSYGGRSPIDSPNCEKNRHLFLKKWRPAIIATFLKRAGSGRL